MLVKTLTKSNIMIYYSNIQIDSYFSVVVKV